MNLLLYSICTTILGKYACSNIVLIMKWKQEIDLLFNYYHWCSCSLVMVWSIFDSYERLSSFFGVRTGFDYFFSGIRTDKQNEPNRVFFFKLYRKALKNITNRPKKIHIMKFVWKVPPGTKLFKTRIFRYFSCLVSHLVYLRLEVSVREDLLM